MLNYLFSITKVRTRDYFFASWLGMLPGTIMYVYLGSAAKDLTQILTGNVERGIGQYVLLGIGLLATIAVTIYVTRIARAALSEYVPEAVTGEHGSIGKDESSYGEGEAPAEPEPDKSR